MHNGTYRIIWWTPTNGLPDTGDEVLVCRKEDGDGMGTWFSRHVMVFIDGRFWNNGYFLYPNEIAFWTYLPSPPLMSDDPIKN